MWSVDDFVIPGSIIQSPTSPNAPVRSEGCRGARDWQRHPETRAGVRTAAQVDPAVVRVDDLAHDAEPQPGALHLRGEERVVDSIAQLRRHAGPVVGDLHD